MTDGRMISPAEAARILIRMALQASGRLGFPARLSRCAKITSINCGAIFTSGALVPGIETRRRPNSGELK